MTKPTLADVTQSGMEHVASKLELEAALQAFEARRAERQAEDEAARDLLDFLGDEASDFDFEHWNRGERDILEPALTRRGFTNVGFYMAEQDSFGPLIRGCVAYAPDGQRVRFFYG